MHAGLGIALGGDEARGTVVVAVAQPTPTRLAEALSAAKIREMAELDAGLRVASRALGGGDSGRAALADAFKEQLRQCPNDLGARLSVARLSDQAGEQRRARMHYGVLAFVDPYGLGAHRLRELGPPVALSVDREELVHPTARGSLRDALAALAPHVLGLPPSSADTDQAPLWVERLQAVAQALDIKEFEAAVVVQLADPAWAEPTRPPRLLLARRSLGDDSLARFAAARALAALRSGVPLIEGRSPEDVLALVRAAALLFLPDLRALRGDGGTFVHAWQAELEALGVKPEGAARGAERFRTLEASGAGGLPGRLQRARRRRPLRRLRAALRRSARRWSLPAICARRAGRALPSRRRSPKRPAPRRLGEVRALVELVAFASSLS